MRSLLLAFAIVFVAACSKSADDNRAAVSTVQRVDHADRKFTIVSVDPKRCDIAVHFRRADGTKYGSLNALSDSLEADGRKVLLVTNAGIFDKTGSPLGLFVDSGGVVVSLNTADGDGNFFMKPNGIFAIGRDHRPMIVDSSEFDSIRPATAYATQSGPLLLRNGRLHPRFKPDSENRRTRSGVGILRDGLVCFALSDEPVTFYEFATLFRDRLQCDDALYLDGEMSSIRVPGDADLPGDDRTYAGLIAVTERHP